MQYLERKRKRCTGKQMQDSILRGLWTAFTMTAVCASSAESSMLMGELIFMLSSTISAFETGQEQLDGMWDATIRIATQYQELLTELSPTLSRMETWFTMTSTNQRVQRDQSEIAEEATELLSGISLRLRMLWTKRTFLLKCKNLIRELWFVRLETLQNSQIGSFRIHEDDTSNLQESQFPSSPPAWFENSEEDWENLVGETPPAPRRRIPSSASLRREPKRATFHISASVERADLSC